MESEQVKRLRCVSIWRWRNRCTVWVLRDLTDSEYLGSEQACLWPGGLVYLRRRCEACADNVSLRRQLDPNLANTVYYLFIQIDRGEVWPDLTIWNSDTGWNLVWHPISITLSICRMHFLPSWSLRLSSMCHSTWHTTAFTLQWMSAPMACYVFEMHCTPPPSRLVKQTPICLFRHMPLLSPCHPPPTASAWDLGFAAINGAGHGSRNHCPIDTEFPAYAHYEYWDTKENNTMYCMGFHPVFILHRILY
jgi:hypothetical protein